MRLPLITGVPRSSSPRTGNLCVPLSGRRRRKSSVGTEPDRLMPVLSQRMCLSFYYFIITQFIDLIKEYL